MKPTACDLPTDHVVRKRDKNHTWMNFDATGLRWSDGKAIMEFSHDITMVRMVASGLMDKDGNVKGDLFDIKKEKRAWIRFQKKSASYKKQIYSLAGVDDKN